MKKTLGVLLILMLSFCQSAISQDIMDTSKALEYLDIMENEIYSPLLNDSIGNVIRKTLDSFYIELKVYHDDLIDIEVVLNDEFLLVTLLFFIADGYQSIENFLRYSEISNSCNSILYSRDMYTTSSPIDEISSISINSHFGKCECIYKLKNVIDGLKSILSKSNSNNTFLIVQGNDLKKLVKEVIKYLELYTPSCELLLDIFKKNE